MKEKKSKLLITVFLLLLINAGFSNSIKTLKFNHLTVKSGLSNNDINHINSDTTGYIWIGTEDGLNRYNGHTVDIFSHQPDDSTSISSNIIRKIHVDKTGRTWIATFGGGLNLYDPATETFTSYQVSDTAAFGIKSNYITDIIEDRQGILWLATDSGGLARFDPVQQKFKHFTVNPADDYAYSISYDDVNCLKAFNDTSILVGTAIGLDIFYKNSENFKNILRFDHTSVEDIVIDKNRDIWVATFGEGLFRYDSTLTMKQHYTAENSDLGENIILSLLMDSNSNIWVGSEAKGLYLYSYNDDSFTNYSSNIGDFYSLNHNSIDCMYDDGRGMLWIGTYNGGVNYAQTKYIKFYHYYATNSKFGLNNSVVTSFAETPDGKIWVGTDGGGVSIFDPEKNTFEYLTSDEKSKIQLSSNFVLDLFLDSQNNMWVSTYDGGITKINMTTGESRFYTNIVSENASTPPPVRQVYEDRDGRIWLALSTAGLALYDAEKENFQQFKYSIESESSNIYNNMICLFEDNRNNFWVGTYSGGLNLFDRETWAFKQFLYNPNDTNSIPSNFINDIFQYEENNLLIATTKGLCQYNYADSTFDRIWHDEGLGGNNIKSLEIDSSGNIWIATNKGLFKKSIRSGSNKHYNESDGLQSNQFSLNASFKDSRNTLYFGGTNGFNTFKTSKMEYNKNLPNIVFTDFKIFNRSITHKTNPEVISRPINYAPVINMTYKDYMFSLSFAATNYIDNEKNMYIYKLFGFDDRWNLLRDSRTAVYTNIPPGTYQLVVKGSNNDRRWNKKGKSITIKIKPPFWDTLLFKIFIVIFAGMSIYGYIRIKIHSVRKHNKILKEINTKFSREIDRRKIAEKNLKRAIDEANEANQLKSEFLANISHEIRTPLNAVIGFSELLKQTTSEKIRNKYVKSIKSAGTTLLKLINDILDLSKLEAGKMNIEREPVYFRPLVQEIYAMFQHKIKEKGLDFMLEIDDTIPEVFEFDETRVRQIMINLLGNAVKFTEKGFIKVKVTVFNRTKERFDIRISIIDSGRGIEKEEQKNIFHSFQQNKNQKYNEYGGTGLGLAITEKLVKMMNGEITLESELGKGSTFSVTFFNITVTQGIIQKQDKFFNVRKIHFPGKDVLIVEDVASNRLILTRLLRNLNINAIQAVNGEEALILLENITPDLILMDIRMPVMDGLEATKIIRKNKKFDPVPIIAVTASAEQYSQKNLRETFDDIILKPISKSVIVEVISKFLKYREIPGENERDGGDLTSQCNIADIISDKLLLRELQEKFIHKIPSLLNQMLINDITVFADTLEELAKEYDNECLKQFANKLLEDAENFDIPEVEAGLKQFYEKISNS